MTDERSDVLTAGLFGPAVLVTSSPLVATLADLFAEERAAVAAAVPSRQREFATGRLCARRLLAELGLSGARLPMAADGRPVWPAGFVGSIAHAHGLCVVAVARQVDRSSVGVDVEADRDLAEGTWDLVCTPAEQAWLRQRPAARRGRLAMALFSAKECAFKCLGDRLVERFEPLRIAMEWDGIGAAFRAGSAAGGATASAAGSIVVRGGWIVTGMALPAR